MLRWLIPFLFLSCTPNEQILPLKTLRRSIFKIHVISKDPRFSQPWLYEASQRSSGSGFYLGDGRIMTNAHVVSHGKFISVQRDGDAKPFPVKVEFIAHDNDLAILQVEDPKVLEGSRPLKFGTLPRLQDKVATIGYPRGGEQISVTEGVVSRISYRRYAHPGYDRHLLVQVDSAINPGNSGGPVFKGDKVVGVAFQAHTNAENTGYIIPTPVVERFLKDIEDGKYDGHPDDGLSIVSGAMENEGTRNYHGIKELGGVKIGFVAKYSALSEVLQKEDVILSIQDIPVGVDGKIDYFGERIDFKVLYDQAQIGDKLKFEVYRDGKILNLPVTVRKGKSHYNRSNVYTLHPRFLTFGGLIFTELSRDYLKAWGDKWYYNAPIHLRYLHRYYYLEKRYELSRDIIVLADVLPDRTNIEGSYFKEQVIDKVNGTPVHSLEELDDLLKLTPENKLLRIDFWNYGLPLVLSYEDLAQSHKELLERYKVKPDKWLGGRDQDGAIAGRNL